MRPSCAPHAPPHAPRMRRPAEGKVDGLMHVEKEKDLPAQLEDPFLVVIEEVLLLSVQSYYNEETIPRQHTLLISSRDLSCTMLHRQEHVFLPYKNRL